MKRFNAFTASSVAVCITASFLVGCGQSDDKQSAPTETSPTASAPIAAQAQPQSAPVTPPPPSPEQWKRQVRTYRQSGDYDKAAQYLLSIQQQQLQQLNEQQANAYWKQMREFQSDLASRVAAGDPRAVAAAERLRKSASH